MLSGKIFMMLIQLAGCAFFCLLLLLPFYILRSLLSTFDKTRNRKILFGVYKIIVLLVGIGFIKNALVEHYLPDYLFKDEYESNFRSQLPKSAHVTMKQYDGYDHFGKGGFKCAFTMDSISFKELEHQYLVVEDTSSRTKEAFEHMDGKEHLLTPYNRLYVLAYHIKRSENSFDELDFMSDQKTVCYEHSIGMYHP